MAIRIGKKTHAKKYVNKPEFKDHAYYEPERLLKQWQQEGASDEELKTRLIAYIEDERRKCIEDITYFAERYGFITGPGGAGIIPFKLENYQRSLLASFQLEKYIIVNKARQLGVSTSLVFYALWFSIFSTGKRCLVVAHRKESAEEFVTKLKTAYEFLPEWLKPSCTLYSKNTVEFDTKSVVKAMTSNPNAARSFSATVFLIDEAAFIKDADEVVKAITPTVAASGGSLIAISTPNGNSDSNWFYRTFSTAKAGQNNWKHFEFSWQVSSIFSRNPNFRQDQIRLDNGNVDKFRQEYECCFDVNLHGLFSKETLDAFKPNALILNKNFGGVTYEDTFYIWETADPAKNYRIGVDCASNKATAKDYTTFQVIDEDTQEQVAEYMGKLPTEVFVDILIKAGRHYNNATMVIEANSYSEMVFYLLENRGYQNIWYDPMKNTPGFQTNRATRSLLIEKLLLFYNRPASSAKLKSGRLKLQMENFAANSVYADGSKKFEAAKGNDDLVIALALAVVTMVPKEHIHRPIVDFGIAVDTKLMDSSGEYSEEYLDYHSNRMGISKDMLANRLKMYHRIKSGVYDGSGLEDITLQHPVEEFERQLSENEFVGSMSTIISDNYRAIESLSLIPKDRKFSLDDIFSEEFQTVAEMHRNFLWNRNF